VLVKLRAKPGGPPSKAKYSWTTDSEQVWRLKGEKNRNKRSQKNLKPCIYKQWKTDGPQGPGSTAYLLHNGPASYASAARLNREAVEPKRKRV
jgi:hypothetical protein